MAKSKQEQNRYYVYKLIDPRTGWPFYVGKGTGNRTWQHLSVSRDTVAELLEGEAERAIDESFINESGIGAQELVEQEHSRVRQRVKEIRQTDLDPIVQWLIKKDGQDMNEQMAFAVEAALIDTLWNLPLDDKDRIVNKVFGHDYVFGAHESLSVVAAAEAVDLPEDRNFVVVASKGVWGGLDSTGQFAGATRQLAWENAHEAWPMGQRAFDHVNAAAGTDAPVILLGLATDPLGRYSNIVVCVEELSGVGVIPHDDLTRPEHAGGKRFMRPDEELASTTELRDSLTGNAPFLQGKPALPNVLLVYKGPWHNKVIG